MTELPAPPDDALERLLPSDVADDPAEWRHPAELDVWYGVVWSRLGRADLAWEWWAQADADPLRAWIAAERGRCLRELGLHGEAERLDEEGLARASDPVDTVMLRLGLAADAVGAGEPERAELRLRSAQDVLDALPHGPRVARQRLRATWVAVEVATIAGGALPLSAIARWDDERDAPMLPDDHAYGTEFHRAKGLMFAGICHDDLRLLDAALGTAPPVLEWAIQLARADRGVEGAFAGAREAFGAVVPPPGYEDAVRRTPTARRLRGDPIP